MNESTSAAKPTEGGETFITHLLELRTRLLHAAYGFCVALLALAIWPGPSRLIDWIALPIRKHMPVGSKLIATDVFSPFFIPIKVLALSALLLTLPWVVYQVWRFVAPGLYQHEKRFALPLIALGSLLAYTGLAFVQFFILDKMFAFIQHFTPESVAATPDIASYIQAILSLYLAFAAAFQVPVVVILLVKMGLVSLEQLRAFRRYFIVVAFVIAAIVTPPDVVSQISLAIPMCLLYELGLFLARYFLPKTLQKSENI